MLEDLVVLVSISLITSFMLFSNARSTLIRKAQHIKLAQRSSYDIFGANSDDEHHQQDYIHSPNFTEQDTLDILKQNPAVYTAIAKLRDLVIRDFINSWFANTVSHDNAFPNEVAQVIDLAFAKLATRIFKVDWASFLMSEAVVFFTNLLRHVRLIEEELMKNDRDFANEKDQKIRKEMLLEEILATNQLHPGVNEPREHLRKVSTKLIKCLMRDSDHKCNAARLLVREVFTNNILNPVMGFVTTYWINYGITVMVSKFASSMQEFEDEDEDDAYMDETSPAPSLIFDETDSKLVSRKKSDQPHGIEHQENLDAEMTSEAVEDGSPFSNKTQSLLSPSISEHPTERSFVTLKPSLPSKSGTYYAAITGWQYAYDASHKPFVLYRLDLKQGGSKWTTWKRYSHFIKLHNKLCKSFPSFKAKFPKKKILDFLDNFDQKFLDQRATELNQYINDGILFDTQCTESDIWRKFVIPGGDGDDEKSPFEEKETTLEANLRKSTKDEEIEKKDSSPSFSSFFATIAGPTPVSTPKLISPSGLNSTTGSTPRSFEYKEYSSELTKPVYDLVGEIFELEKKGFFQRQIGWIATHLLQLVDRKLHRIYHDALVKFTQEENIASMIGAISNIVWPNGTLFSPGVPITEEQKQKTAAEAQLGLSELIPPSVKTFLGQEFVELRLLKLYRFFQLEPLVRHLSFTLLDKVVGHLVRLKAPKARPKSGLRQMTMTKLGSALKTVL